MPEERREVHTTTFAKKSKNTHNPRNFTFDTYGYQPDGKPVAPEYLVKITSFRLQTTVVAVLQEDILTRVESRWEPFVPTALLAPLDLGVQWASGGRKSIITKATSRRIWQGSSPMTISLNLKFEAVEDPSKEVVHAARLLQSMALPSEPSGGIQTLTLGGLYGAYGAARHLGEGRVKALGTAINQLPTLAPPGPTPFTWEGILSAETSWADVNQADLVEGAEGGDLIVIQIGRFLSFWNVILKEVTALHKLKFDPQGDPISGAVNLIFESYEMMTKESLEESYQKTSLSKTTQEEIGE